MLLPLFAFGQRYKSVTKREAEQLGKKTYVATSGEVTKVVNTVGSGLEDQYSQFLFRKPGNPEADSIFSNINSNYNSLEEAAIETDQLLRALELDRKNSDTNEAIEFWIAKRNRENKKKEKEAEKIVNEVLKKDPTVEELALEKIRFGNKPTYYINGVEVEQSLVNKLYSAEIVKREIRAKDTASGNPNGEVWYTVTDKTLARLNIPLEQTINYLFRNTGLSSNNQLSKYLEEKEQERKRLESRPVIRRQKPDDGQLIDTRISPDNNKQNQENNTSRDSDTQVISRTINNEVVIGSENQVTPDSSTATNSSKKVTTSKFKKEEPKKEKSPKRSVKKIKQERESRYDDELGNNDF